MKLFTVEEANASLPRAKEIVLRICQTHKRIKRMQPEAEQAAAAAKQFGGGGTKYGIAYVTTTLKLAQAVEELNQLGIQLKDYERGLIDFPCWRDGRVVLLCWQLGEADDEIRWWHEVEAGFAGRQKL